MSDTPEKIKERDVVGVKKAEQPPEVFSCIRDEKI